MRLSRSTMPSGITIREEMFLLPRGRERRSTETSGRKPIVSAGRWRVGSSLISIFMGDGGDELSEDYIETIPDSRDEYRAFEERQQLEQAAEVLTERERRVINDIYFLDLTCVEVAARLGISVQRVWQIRRRALLKLKKRLESM